MFDNDSMFVTGMDTNHLTDFGKRITQEFNKRVIINHKRWFCICCIEKTAIRNWMIIFLRNQTVSIEVLPSGHGTASLPKIFLKLKLSILREWDLAGFTCIREQVWLPNI